MEIFAPNLEHGRFQLGQKMTLADNDICALSATTIAAQISDRSLSGEEVTRAFLQRIETFNPTLNAVCTLNEEALSQAQAADQRLAQGASARLLEGVPFLAKDILHTKGIRTTFGSLIREHFIPGEDTLSVERLKAAGAILLGKTNTPEFAHDIHTTNKIFGATRNPFDVNVTAGGSSGGSGAAVAARLAPVAIGTDLGGSIRIPCSYNGIAGVRPSPGRVPVYPNEFGWDTLVAHVHGPMTWSAADLGLVLQALAGPDDRDPSSLPAAACDYSHIAVEPPSLKNLRIAYVGNLDGLFPLDPEVEALTKQAAYRFESLGCIVEETAFDTSGLRDIIAGTRGFGMVGRYADLYDAHKEQMTDQLINQVSTALTLDVRTVVAAEKLRTVYWQRVRRFLESYDYIIAPAVGAPPFRLDQPLPTEVGGLPVKRYYDVFLACYAFSVTGLPIAAVPCGLTRSGLPIGIQIVARRLRDDRAVAAAAAYAQIAPEVFSAPEVDISKLQAISGDLSTPGMAVKSDTP